MDTATNNIKNIYQKHQSFDTFRSCINSSIDQQKERALCILEANRELFLSEKLEIIDLAISDLKKEENQNPDFKINLYVSDELSKIEDNDVCRYIYHRYRYDVFPKHTKIDTYPPYLQIEPSSICNFRCVFCYQTDKGFTDKKNGHMGTMSLDMFKNIIDQIEGNIDFISVASRGEPLVCRDIGAMLKYTEGKFLGLKLNTNASLLNEENCHIILSGGVNTVVFSADAAEEPLYSQLRVGGKLEKVLQNIKLFQDIKNKYYPKSKIITRVSGVKLQNDQNMDNMIGVWGDLVDQIAFVKYNPWENVYASDLSNVSKPCSDLWRRMFVWYDGKVNPCDTDYRSTLAVGNLERQAISELWRSDSYKKLRQFHVGNCRNNVEPCKRCTVI